MFASVCKSIWQRTVEYQRRGLHGVRHGVILLLGLGIASTVLMVSGNNPFAPTPAFAFTSFADSIISVFLNVDLLPNIAVAFVGGLLVQLFGIIMTIFVFLVVAVASYDVVINTPNVIVAWKVLRDVVNLFFVIILLIIAIGTTLRREQYMWNKNLPRFIIAAIFVNFSRTIVAFVTDFADVIQQTFVSGFNSVGFAKLISSFGIPFFAEMATTNVVMIPLPLVVLVSTVLVVIMELIVCAIMFVYFVLFLGRVVLLWLLAIFGPVAFVSSILPQTQKYYKDWWSKLSQAAILGPMLAFFLWLSITLIPGPAEAAETFMTGLTGAPETIGAATQPSFMVGFFLMTILLYFGMQQGMGMAGDFGSFVGKAQSFAFGTVLGGMAGLATGAVKGAGGFGLKKADDYFTAGRQRLGAGIQSSFKGNKIMETLGGAVGAGGTIRTMAAGYKQSRDEANKENDLRNQNLNAAAVTNMTTQPQRILATLTQPTVERGAQTKNAMSLLDEAAASIEDNKAGEATEKIDEAKLILNNPNLTVQDKTKIQERIDEMEKLNAPGAEAKKMQDDVNLNKKLAADVQTQIDDIMDQEVEYDDINVVLAPLQRKLTVFTNKVDEGNDAIAGTERKQEIAKRLVGAARQKNDKVYQEGASLQAGARKFGPIDLSNVTREAVMRNANADKVVREGARKRMHDLAFGEGKNMETATLESMESGDHIGTLTGVEGLIEDGKLMDLYKSGNGRKILERGLQKLYKDKGMDDRQIAAALEKFRQQPGSPEYTAAALEGLTSLTSAGDGGLQADQLERLQSLAKAAHGDQVAGMTYVEMSTGNTKIIPVKVDSDGGISFEEKAKKAKVAGLKRATPEKILNNWQVTTVVNNNANGDPSAMSSTFKDQLKYLTGMADDQARKFIPADVKLVLRKIESRQMTQAFRAGLGDKELQENFDMVMRAVKPKPGSRPSDEDTE